jgi:hypothetical protein
MLHLWALGLAAEVFSQKFRHPNEEMSVKTHHLTSFEILLYPLLNIDMSRKSWKKSVFSQ